MLFCLMNGCIYDPVSLHGFVHDHVVCWVFQREQHVCDPVPLYPEDLWPYHPTPGCGAPDGTGTGAVRLQESPGEWVLLPMYALTFQENFFNPLENFRDSILYLLYARRFVFSWIVYWPTLSQYLLTHKFSFSKSYDFCFAFCKGSCIKSIFVSQLGLVKNP